MRTPRARALAEDALRDLLAAMGPHGAQITVVGGLNPPLLAPFVEAPHQGTVDIDVVLDLAPVYDRDEQDFGWLESALLSAGFAPAKNGPAWRWTVRREGVDVHIDVLCDVLDNQGQELALPGARTVTAMNLMGPSAALADGVRRPVTVLATDDFAETELQVRYAGLGGYLLAKATALLGRQALKDTYDLAFVILHNPGGPRGAGVAARQALPPDREAFFVASLRGALTQLLNVESPALHAYAEQRVRDGMDDDPLTIRLDVVAAARSCLAAFDAAVAAE